MKRCKYELAVENYFGLNPNNMTEKTIINADFGQLCNLLAMFEQQNRPIKQNFKHTEVKHILTLISQNEIEGDYFGNKKQYWNRSEKIKNKLRLLI